MGQRIQLSENQLRNLIKESVKKALMNEISSDMIGRASKKFHQKYGGTDFPGPDAKDFPKDEYGNLLYPKDKRTLAQHYRNFNDAYNNAKYDEEREDPETMKAIEIWENEKDYAEWDEDAQCDILETDDGWTFWAEYDSVDYEGPNGESGSFSTHKIERR